MSRNYINKIALLTPFCRGDLLQNICSVIGWSEPIQNLEVEAG
jgi:hypothetical protein